MKRILLLFGMLCLCNSLHAQSKSEEAAVRTAILDYVESFYQADTTKVHASVHPEMAKRGYYKENGQYKEAKMNFPQMVSLSKRWSKSHPVPANAPKDITIFEIKDKIATARLKAMWGTDYFHLAKNEGQWKIVNVIWQD